MPVAQPDGSQARALLLEFRFVRAQLRDVLAAEHSAVMADEDHNCGSISPQRAEPDVMAIKIGQNDARQLSAKRLLHGGSFSIAPRHDVNQSCPARTCTRGRLRREVREEMVPGGRIELPTPAFSGPRSTGELPRHRGSCHFTD